MNGIAAPRSTTAEQVRRLRDMSGLRDGPHARAALLYLASTAACIWAWAGPWPVAVGLWLVLAWLGHAALARLHEAVHGMLSPSRRRNEISGIAIGTLALTPMSVYRYVHARHHAWLGRPGDPEFRPYNQVDASRAKRLVYAWAELLLGVVVTPALYSIRTARDWRRHRPAVRRRLAFEWALLFGFWGGLLAVVHVRGWWVPLAVGYLVPAWITGTLQSIRKFTEHLGMAGDSIPAMTRTVVYRSWLGRWLSKSQLYVDHHGTHHRWPRIPWYHLPRATPLAYSGVDDPRLYRSHLDAVLDALRHLGNPKVGPQWLAAG